MRKHASILINLKTTNYNHNAHKRDCFLLVINNSPCANSLLPLPHIYQVKKKFPPLTNHNIHGTDEAPHKEQFL